MIDSNKTKEFKMNEERFTIVHNDGINHYDTNDECFYSLKWERTLDKKDYLELLIKNNPEKFADCHIEEFSTNGE